MVSIALAHSVSHLRWPCPCSSQEDLIYTAFTLCLALELFSPLILSLATHSRSYSPWVIVPSLQVPLCHPHIIINPLIKQTNKNKQNSLFELSKVNCATCFLLRPQKIPLISLIYHHFYQNQYNSLVTGLTSPPPPCLSLVYLQHSSQSDPFKA